MVRVSINVDGVRKELEVEDEIAQVIDALNEYVKVLEQQNRILNDECDQSEEIIEELSRHLLLSNLYLN